MKNINTVSFSADKKKNKNHLPVGFIVFLIMAAGLVSALIIFAINDFSFSKMIGRRTGADEASSVTEETTTTVSTGTVDSDEFSFLFVCFTESTNDVSFASVLTVMPEENRLRVKPVDPGFMVADNMSFREAFKAFDIEAIMRSLNDSGIPIARYGFVTESNFTALLQLFGSLGYILDSDFSYKSDSITHTFAIGDEISGEALSAYLITKGGSPSSFDEFGTAAVSIIEDVYTMDSLSRGEDLFTAIVNYMKTDITAADYESSKDVFYSICEQGYTVSVNN